MQGFENFDFPNCRNRETIFFLLGVDTLERHNLIGNLISRHKDTAIGSFANLMHTLINIFIAQDNGSLDGNRRLYGRTNAFNWR